MHVAERLEQEENGWPFDSRKQGSRFPHWDRLELVSAQLL